MQYSTGFFDTKGNLIREGDLLLSENGYTVFVYWDEKAHEWCGALNCPIGHSCRDIPYDLNNGKGYTKIFIE